MNAYALLPLLGFVVNAGLAVLVLTRSARAGANRLYALFALTLAYWCLLKFTYRLADSEAAALALFKLSALGWCMLPSLFLHFVLAYVREPGNGRGRGRGWIGLVHGAGALFALCAQLPGVMVAAMVRTPSGFVQVNGPAYAGFGAYVGVVFGAALVVLFRGGKRNANPAVRLQRPYLLLGIVVPLLGALAHALLPMVGVPVVEQGETLSTFNALLVALAIVRHGPLAVGLEQAAETVIATMGDALLVVNRSGRVVLSNPATRRLLQLEAEAVLSRPVAELFEAAVFSQPIDELGPVHVEEAHALAADGTRVPVSLTLSTIEGIDGRPAGMVCVARDLAEVRRVMGALADANKRLEQQAITDELTGIFNRRHGNHRLLEEFERSKRDGRAFSVGLLDLDDFKLVNDKYGHQVGDRLLQAVARVLRTSLRTVDLVVRWGGDEFLIIFPDTDAEEVRHASRRVIDIVQSTVVPGLPARLHASFGVATLDPVRPPADPEALVQEADDALYDAKRGGKGRFSAGRQPRPTGTG